MVVRIYRALLNGLDVLRTPAKTPAPLVYRIAPRAAAGDTMGS